MSNPYILLPIITHLAVAILLLFFWRKKNTQKLISVLGNLLSVGIAIWLFSIVWTKGIHFTQAGNWQAPFGIPIIADTLSAILVLLTAICGFAVSVYSVGSIRNARVNFGYFPILHFLLMGLNGAFMTGDIFNLYVWFEVIIISSFVLLTIGGEKSQIEGSIKYFTMNLLASITFLTAIAILYGLTGSLNMADLSMKVAALENRGLVNVTAFLFFVGFGIKSAVFPLYFWLPASYHTPPPAISAIFGGLLTKVGVYALLRIFTLIFIPDTFMMNLICIVAGLTILSGALGAMTQVNLRKIFSYLIICHIGYMIAGLGLFTELAITGAIVYLIHDIIVKTNLFMVAGLIFKIKGTYNIKKLGSLYAEYPKLSLLMAIPLFSLVGIPPLSGFWGKLFLIDAGFQLENYVLVGFIVLGSFLTLFVIAKVWAQVFWKDGETMNPKEWIKYFKDLKPLKQQAMVISIVLLGLVSLYIGFGAEHIIIVSERVAHELMDNRIYVQTILQNR